MSDPLLIAPEWVLLSNDGRLPHPWVLELRMPGFGLAPLHREAVRRVVAQAAPGSHSWTPNLSLRDLGIAHHLRVRLSSRSVAERLQASLQQIPAAWLVRTKRTDAALERDPLVNAVVALAGGAR